MGPMRHRTGFGCSGCDPDVKAVVWLEAAFMPTTTSQSSPVAEPATSPAPVHDFVTPVVHEIPRGPVEPASFASVW